MKKVYSYQDEAECAYLLKNGTVFFEIKDKELYKITGKNLIVGAGEVILNNDSESYFYRTYNFYKNDSTELAEISPASLMKLILRYNIGYNMNVFFAHMIKTTNKILAKRQLTLTDDVKIVHEISKIYFEMTNSLLELAKKTKFPDIIQISEKHKNELIYETGKIFSQETSAANLKVEKEKLDDFNISFSPNSVICLEGEKGNEMYILSKGRIGVMINENKIAEIDQPGTVIGEIALLLGETRTATLKAIDNVILSIIKKDNLPEFHATHETVFIEIGKTLAKRINNNFQMIHNIDQRAKDKHDKKIAGFLTRDRAENHLKTLEKDLSELYRKKGYEQLKEMIEKVEDGITKFTG